MAKNQKRKFAGNPNDSPQKSKLLKKIDSNKSQSPNGLQQQSPNSKKRNKLNNNGSPKDFKVNIKKEPITPKLEMFSGTANLDFPSKATNAKKKSNIKKEHVKQERVSPMKKEPNNMKQEAISPKQQQQLKNSVGLVKNQEKKSKNLVQNAVIQNNTAEKKPNRHNRRREELKYKRIAARQKFNELKVKVLQGDKDALKEAREKLDTMENAPGIGKNRSKQLASLKKIVSRAGSAPGIKMANKQQNKQKSKKQGKKNNQQQSNLLKEPAEKQTVKNKQSKPIVKKEQEPINVSVEVSESDENSDEEMDEQSTGGEGDKIEEDINEEEESSDEDEEESADEDEEESSDEEEEESSGEEEESSGEGADEVEESSKSEDKIDLQKNKNKKTKQLESNKQANTKGAKIQKDSASAKSKQEASKPKVSRYVVFVGNLPFDGTKEELKEHFKKVGDIVDIRIPQDEKTKKYKGFAYIEVKNEEAYQKALSLHHTVVKGRRINVLYTKGGKKKTETQKSEIKAKNFKLQAMRKQGLLAGSVKADQKRSVRRAKKRNFTANNDK